jgi:orotate phosphoribosyltransferase
MPLDVFASLPVHSGHFLMESGYHADLWIDLERLFIEPAKTEPMIAALAERLRAHNCAAICGPLTGGAFLAQRLAAIMGTSFYYTERLPSEQTAAVFSVEYALPPAVRNRVRGARVAVVDDVISMGSSVRATMAALSRAAASTTVVGSLMTLGDVGVSHLMERGVPLETLERRTFTAWQPSGCPLCASGVPLEKPGERP